MVEWQEDDLVGQGYCNVILIGIHAKEKEIFDEFLKLPRIAQFRATLFRFEKLIWTTLLRSIFTLDIIIRWFISKKVIDFFVNLKNCIREYEIISRSLIRRIRSLSDIYTSFRNFLIDPIKIIWIIILCNLLKFSQTFAFDQKLKRNKIVWRKEMDGEGERVREKKRKKDRTALEESPERLDILSACSHLFN